MKRQQSTHAQCAAAIRQELGKAFPLVKFSVTAQSFSMGDSVHISWCDGPTVREVKEISDKYQYGSFDGMTDMYNNTNSRDDIPQVKYVQESRSQGRESKSLLLPKAQEIFNDHDFGCACADNLLYRIFCQQSFPGGAKITGIEKTDAISGQVHDFFRITFELPEAKESTVINAGDVQLVDYSEKAIAIFGDTKPIKDTLHKLGGRFNRNLRGRAGWIFPKTKEQSLRQALQIAP